MGHTIKLLLLLPFLLSAQTSTGFYGRGCGGSGCAWSHFASAGNHTTDPVFVYVTGGGGSSYATVCPPNVGNPDICAQLTAATSAGYQAYTPLYTLPIGGAALPAANQDLACFFSTAVANPSTFPGNWQNILLVGESFGPVVMNPVFAGPVGKYLTDSNGNCATSNTNWHISAVGYISGIPNFYDATNGFCALKSADCSDWWHTAPTLAQMQDASLDFWLSVWQTKGWPRLVQLYGTADVTIPPPSAALLASDIAAGGFTGLNVQVQVLAGYGHPVDDGVINAADSWPFNLANIAGQSTPNCNHTAPGSGGLYPAPAGYPICGSLGYAGRYSLDVFLPKASGSSGVSSAAGGS